MSGRCALLIVTLQAARVKTGCASATLDGVVQHVASESVSINVGAMVFAPMVSVSVEMSGREMNVRCASQHLSLFHRGPYLASLTRYKLLLQLPLNHGQHSSRSRLHLLQHLPHHQAQRHFCQGQFSITMHLHLAQHLLRQILVSRSLNLPQMVVFR